MEDVTSLDELRGRVGLEAALGRIAAAGEEGKAVVPAVEAVLTRTDEPILLGEMAALCGLRPFQFASTFKEVAAIDFHEFVDRARVDATLVALATSDARVDAVAESYGFLSVATLGLSIAEYTGLPLPAVLAVLRP